MIKRTTKFFLDLRDFIELFYNPAAVLQRHRRVPRGLDAPAEEWSFRH